MSEGLSARLMDNVLPEPNSGCWLWTGQLSQCGYPRLKVNGRDVRAHREAYRLFCGPLAQDEFVCHRCDVPACINPAHLFAGTPADNSRDMTRKGRAARRAGELNTQAKLKLQDVQQIRAAVGSHRQIAARFGVSPSLVGLIRQGKAWATGQAN